MNTKNIILVIILAVVLGALVIMDQHHKSMQPVGQTPGHHEIYYCPMHPQYTSEKPGTCPICSMKLVKKETAQQTVSSSKDTQKKIRYWTDPMIPGYKADGPGKSPMGMDLIPVYEQESTDGQTAFVPGYATVSVTAQKQQLIGIKTALVGKKSTSKTIRVAGYVSTNHELYQLQDEYVQDYINYVTVYRDYKRFKDTRRNWESHREIRLKLHEVEDKLLRLGLGPMQIEQLQKFSWKIPWDQPDLLFLKDHFEYWVVAQIFEGDLGFVQAGQEADIDISAYGQKTKGTIRSIGGTLSPQTRTVNALIELKGYRGELKGNMFVNVVIPVKLNEVVVVPREAVMDTGLRKVVFVQKNAGTFEPRVIQTGFETDDGFEVKSGLKKGERIVTSGNFLLDSESRIQGGLEETPKTDTLTAAGGDSHGQ